VETHSIQNIRIHLYNGTVTGGNLNGTIWPDRNGGMIHGGTLSGSIMPGNEGGMIIGGPLNGSIVPPR
jgi:hypothetical protein